MFFVSLFALFALLGVFPGSVSVHAAFPRRKVSHTTLFSRGNVFEATTFLNAHNAIRTEHNASALTWSPILATKAELWADRCQLKFSDGVLSDQPYGENIAAATGIFPILSAVDVFSRDQASYDPANPTYTPFTQIVWKSTTQLGCAFAKCDGIFDKSSGKATLYVCLYDPVGNVAGEAADNVQI